QGGDHSAPHQHRKRPVAAAQPQERRGRPEARQPRVDAPHLREILRHRQDAARSDERVDLEGERVEGREEDESEGAEKDPARPEETRGAAREEGLERRPCRHHSTMRRSPAPRPNTSGLYISSAFGGGTTKLPGVVARATYVYS